MAVPVEITLGGKLYRGTVDEVLAPAPTATLSASPTAVRVGQAYTLTWSTANATSARLDGAAVSTSGSKSVTPTAAGTATHRLEAFDASGRAATPASVTVTVTAVTTPPAGKRLLGPADFRLLGHHLVPRGTVGELAYGQSMTLRRVGTELRVLTLAYNGTPPYALAELAVPARVGDPLTLRSYRTDWTRHNHGNHMALWCEQRAGQPDRLWLAQAVDYPDADWGVWEKGWSSCTLNPGPAAHRGLFGLQGVSWRSCFGGFQAVPGWFRRKHNAGPYAACGGSYASLMATGPVSMGLFLATMSDPHALADNAVLPASQYKVFADHRPDPRGERGPGVLNYYDGGDPRGNPDTKPTDPPLATAAYLSPNARGRGWWVWGDSYWNNHSWVDSAPEDESAGAHGYLAVGTFSRGKAWYQSSTLNRERWGYELHVFDPAKFGVTSPNQVQPEHVVDLPLPGMDFTAPEVLGGDAPWQGVYGSAYDAATKRLYLWCGWDRFIDGRLFVYEVNA